VADRHVVVPERRVPSKGMDHSSGIVRVLQRSSSIAVESGVAPRSARDSEGAAAVREDQSWEQL